MFSPLVKGHSRDEAGINDTLCELHTPTDCLSLQIILVQYTSRHLRQSCIKEKHKSCFAQKRNTVHHEGKARGM